MKKELISLLERQRSLAPEQWRFLLENRDEETAEFLFSHARAVQQAHYGNKVYIRGLIEFTNYCRNNCYYCGIRRDNTKVSRYRLSRDEMLECCRQGYEAGFRTFVFQGGEDLSYTDEFLCGLIEELKVRYPDCAVTLSIGEREKESYQRYFAAGADRYLLRHETANTAHYQKLHPPELSLENRKRCLYDLKEIGYQVGCGFMVGSPFQTVDNLVEDLLFLTDFQPEMVGIGPFIPHHDTPFRDQPAGSMELTLFLLGLIRLLLPSVLLPATTALGTIHPEGRELGILAGANVVMPNLSPTDVREKYTLYDNKLHTGGEALEGRLELEKRMERIGYQVAVARGDHEKFSVN